MTKTFKKNIRRSITGSLGRYLAILLIIMLGVAFLTGVTAPRPVITTLLSISFFLSVSSFWSFSV